MGPFFSGPPACWERFQKWPIAMRPGCSTSGTPDPRLRAFDAAEKFGGPRPCPGSTRDDNRPIRVSKFLPRPPRKAATTVPPGERTFGKLLLVIALNKIRPARRGTFHRAAQGVNVAGEPERIDGLDPYTLLPKENPQRAVPARTFHEVWRPKKALDQPAAGCSAASVRVCACKGLPGSRDRRDYRSKPCETVERTLQHCRQNNSPHSSPTMKQPPFPVARRSAQWIEREKYVEGFGGPAPRAADPNAGTFATFLPPAAHPACTSRYLEELIRIGPGASTGFRGEARAWPRGLSSPIFRSCWKRSASVRTAGPSRSFRPPPAGLGRAGPTGRRIPRAVRQSTPRPGESETIGFDLSCPVPRTPVRRGTRSVRPQVMGPALAASRRSIPRLSIVSRAGSRIVWPGRSSAERAWPPRSAPQGRSGPLGAEPLFPPLAGTPISSPVEEVFHVGSFRGVVHGLILGRHHAGLTFL